MSFALELHMSMLALRVLEVFCRCFCEESDNLRPRLV